MASPTQEGSTKLLNIYHQIESATSLFDLLGLPSTGSPTPKDVKTAYHALALQIHPDKCQPDQTELHTRLFKKVQDAYEQLTEYQEKITKDSQCWQNADSREEAPKSTEKPTSGFNHGFYHFYCGEDVKQAKRKASAEFRRQNAEREEQAKKDAFAHIFVSMAKEMSEDEGIDREDEAARQQENQRHEEYQEWKSGLLRDYGIGRWG